MKRAASSKIEVYTMAKITLYDNHPPSLTAGTYKIEVTQTLTVGNDSLTLELPDRKNGNGTTTGAKDLEFTVAGEHYALNSLQIDSVFPPAGAMGDFSLVLPHIILNRSTLPWENGSGDGKGTTPWLALLLFQEGEISASEGKDFFVRHIPVSAWESAPNEPPKSQSPKEDQVSIIVCANPTGWDSTILPTYDELSKFVHVRSTDGVEKAVVVSKRLPEKDEKNIVHLVSLENCFDATGAFAGKSIDSKPALISLKSWEFFCNDHFIISEELIESDSSGFTDDQKVVLLRIKGSEYFNDADLIKAITTQGLSINANKAGDQLKTKLLTTFRIGHLPDILKHLDRKNDARLRLATNNTVSDPVITAGYVTIPYYLKTGNKIDALYRGPMIPQTASPATDFVPLFHADKAFRYIKEVDKLDVSYAAAWELGKLLAIQNKNFSIALYQWKRACYQAIKLSQKKSPGTSPVLPAPPPYVKTWFDNVKDLKGIPIDYLIPDPALIPFESIRFFEIDETWLKYLIDGAFSIGRISDAEKTHDQTVYAYPGFEFLHTSDTMNRSGFLLHSVAVAGWPNLVIYDHSGGQATNSVPVGYDDLPGQLDNNSKYDFGEKLVDVAFGTGDTFYYKNGVSGQVEFSKTNFGIGQSIANSYTASYRNTPYRKDKLSPNLLICLFKEPIRTIGIHQKPESIHFAILEENDGVKKYTDNGIAGIDGLSGTPTASAIAQKLMENAEVEVVQFALGTKGV